MIAILSNSYLRSLKGSSAPGELRICDGHGESPQRDLFASWQRLAWVAEAGHILVAHASRDLTFNDWPFSAFSYCKLGMWTHTNKVLAYS